MSVNKAILIGHAGKDPDVKYFENDVAVATFSLATSDRAYKTRDGQDVPERTEWHNIVAWKNLAKLAESYIKKGSHLYIEGKIRTRTYDDQNGIKRYVTEIFADTIQLLGKKSDSENSYETTVHQPVTQTNTTVNVQQIQGEDTYVPGVSEVEDDLPF